MISILHPGLSPNTQSDDLRLAWREWFRPTEHSDILTRFESRLSEWSQRDAILTSCGRSALDLILDAYNIRSGDRVAVPAFTCVAVLGPLVQRGITPVYLDVDDSFRLAPDTIQRLQEHAPKALIFIDLFGIDGDVIPVIQWCRNHGVLVIEDAAHALGNQMDGQAFGTRGDVGFSSFGRDKMFSSVFGGVIFSPSKDVSHRIRLLRDEKPLPPTRLLRSMLLQPILTSFARRTFRFGGRYVLGLCRRLRVFPLAVEPAEYEGHASFMQRFRFHPSLAVLAEAQWNKRDLFQSHRSELVRVYERGFGGRFGGAPLLRYPLVLAKPQEAISALRRAGIVAGDWYDQVVAPKRVNLQSVHYEQGMCPKAESLSVQTINLPTHIHTTVLDAERIVEIVRPYVHDHA